MEDNMNFKQKAVDFSTLTTETLDYMDGLSIKQGELADCDHLGFYIFYLFIFQRKWTNSMTAIWTLWTRRTWWRVMSTARSTTWRPILSSRDLPLAAMAAVTVMAIIMPLRALEGRPSWRYSWMICVSVNIV